MDNNSKDKTEINKVINSFFSVFDNRLGKTPDFNIIYDLFIRKGVIVKKDKSGLEIMSLDEFVKPREILLTSGSLTDFNEWETESTTVIENGIAIRKCKYEKKGLLNGEHYSGRGDKHIQLAKTENEWKIVSVLWQDEP